MTHVGVQFRRSRRIAVDEKGLRVDEKTTTVLGQPKSTGAPLPIRPEIAAIYDAGSGASKTKTHMFALGTRSILAIDSHSVTGCRP